MKKIFCLALACVMVFSLAACTGSSVPTSVTESSTAGAANVPVLAELATIKASGVLKVGMECNYAPFNWTQAEASDSAVALSGGGYADGYDVQMAKKIAEGLGVKLEIVKMEWGGLVPALTSGTIDAIIAGMSPTADRKLSIDFSDYYYTSSLTIVVMADGNYKDAKALADFSGAKITAQLDTYHYTALDQITGVKKQTAMEDFPSMIVALKAGSIDGYVSEIPGAKSAVAANPSLTYIQFDAGKGFNNTTDEVSISVGLRQGSDVAAAINEVLAGITADERTTMMDTAIANQPLSSWQ